MRFQNTEHELTCRSCGIVFGYVMHYGGGECIDECVCEDCGGFIRCIKCFLKEDFGVTTRINSKRSSDIRERGKRAARSKR